jgi:hypothetical protein
LVKIFEHHYGTCSTEPFHVFFVQEFTMSTTGNLGLLSVSDLIACFENDIRFGCHPTNAEVSRSIAGRELRKRVEANDSGVIPALTARSAEMDRMPLLNDVEKSVRDGLSLLIARIQGGSGDASSESNASEKSGAVLGWREKSWSSPF